ncbi:hypothetical protein CCUS01_11534 [Colletotrichum cuscutae]|uniref:Uncharacterized protein n=1 Tax=Colletotrichum cuscutae TaxID=1209917 RepID=A0AAI9XGX6_9PEZI|nr:hypothetical protein CCUS01_11534 [Colletotrichum cuscutae]
MGQTELDCEWGSGYPRCNAMRCLSMPAHSALRCAVNCGLRTADCTWRMANAYRSRARLGHFCEDRLDRTGLRSIHKYQQLPHHTFFSQLTLSLATFAFATFWCSSDLALGTRDISYRFSQQTGIPIDCRRKVWPCRGLVRRLVVRDPSGRHAWTPWTLDLVFLAVFWPRAAGHSLVPDAAKKDLALSVGHPHFACLRFFSQNVRGIHLPYPRAVLFVLPLPILSRYGSCHPS